VNLRRVPNEYIWPEPDAASTMKILFIYSDLSVGGVQTAIVQFSNWLVSQEHEVALAIYDKGDLAPSLSDRVRLVLLPRPPRCFQPGGLHKVIVPRHEAEFDVVCSFDPASMCLAALYLRASSGPVRFVTGVHHPRIYFFARRDSLRESLFRLLYDRYVPDGSKYFMNKECRASHERYFKRSFFGSAIVPVAVEDEAFMPVSRHPKKYRIVSIGRLESFKTYNIYMLDVLKELLEMGYDAVWDVYGDGGLESEMRRQVSLRGLTERVFFNGTVKCKDIPGALASAYAFVGMGLSLVRAGAQGVPCVPAIGDRGPLSYGYLHELPPYAIGEVLEEEPTRNVSDLLCALFRMSEEQYEAECVKTRDYCRQYHVEHLGPMLMARLQDGPTATDALLKAPSTLFLAVYGLEILRVAKERAERALFRLLHAILPRKLASAIRLRRRQWIGRNAIIR